MNIPKRKTNYFFIYDLKNNKYNDIKYLSQNELAEGYRQIIPRCNFKLKKLTNHFSITLCFLPEYLWNKIKYINNNYKSINDGLTLYSIVETNQDSIMIQLYNEIKKKIPDILILKYLVNELDETQYSSWLVIRSNNYLKTNKHYKTAPVTNLEEYVRNQL